MPVVDQSSSVTTSEQQPAPVAQSDWRLIAKAREIRLSTPSKQFAESAKTSTDVSGAREAEGVSVTAGMVAYARAEIGNLARQEPDMRLDGLCNEEIEGVLRAALSPPPTITETVTVALPAPVSHASQTTGVVSHGDGVGDSRALPAPGEVERVMAAMNAWTNGEQTITGQVWVIQGGKRVASFDSADDAWGDVNRRNAEAAIAVLSPTLATVAAADDEGVARIEFIARVLWADGQRRLKQGQSDLPRTRTDFRNAARALLDHPALATSRSQHEGAE